MKQQTMQNRNILKSCIFAATLIATVSCVKENIDTETANNKEDAIASKLIYSSYNAKQGSLLVKFGDEAVAIIEGNSSKSLNMSGMENLDEVLTNIGVTSIQRLFPIDQRNEEAKRAAGLHRWYSVYFDESKNLDEAAREIAKLSEVTAVEFNIKMENVHNSSIIPANLNAAPATKAETAIFNDPFLSKQWGYINTGDKSLFSGIKEGADINCKDAWKLTTGDPRIIVAVIDECVEWDHPDLAANMWINVREKAGKDGVDDDGNGYIDDIYGYNFANNSVLTVSVKGDAPEHGTHVAGTIAAVNNNNEGVCGIAGGTGNRDGVRLMSCQIFYNGNEGEAETTAKAITYAADNGASIIQCSYGIPSGAIKSDEEYAKNNAAELDAINYFRSKKNCDAIDGGIAIFAAGNEQGAMAGYPSAYRDIIAVTAMSCDFTPAYYTNRGPGCNIAAPGGDAYQSLLEKKGEGSQILSTILGGKYGYSQGTSMACPHVSGVAALGLSYALKLGKTLSRDEFKAMLLTSVNNIDQYCTGTKRFVSNKQYVDLDLSAFAGQMGTGYVDAFQFLMNIRGTTCIPIQKDKQIALKIGDYIGEGANLKIRDITISNEDMENVGMKSKPTVFGDKIVMKCTKTGSAIVKLSCIAGVGNNSGVNGMTITKEFAIIVRDSHSTNGGWF